MKKLLIFLGLLVVFVPTAPVFAQQAEDETQITGGCAPQTCGTFTPDCNPDIRPCYCFEVAEGGGCCIDDFFCSRQQCNNSGQCPEGQLCIVRTCCGPPGNCAPVQCTGQTQGEGDGPRGSGN